MQRGGRLTPQRPSPRFGPETGSEKRREAPPETSRPRSGTPREAPDPAPKGTRPNGKRPSATRPSPSRHPDPAREQAPSREPERVVKRRIGLQSNDRRGRLAGHAPPRDLARRDPRSSARAMATPRSDRRTAAEIEQALERTARNARASTKRAMREPRPAPSPNDGTCERSLAHPRLRRRRKRPQPQFQSMSSVTSLAGLSVISLLLGEETLDDAANSLRTGSSSCH